MSRPLDASLARLLWDEEEQKLLSERLAALEAVPGVDKVYSIPKGTYTSKSWNANHVECRIAFADGSTTKVKEHCSEEAPLTSAAAARLMSRVANALKISVGVDEPPSTSTEFDIALSSSTASTSCSAFEYMQLGEAVQAAERRALHAEDAAIAAEREAAERAAEIVAEPHAARTAAWQELAHAKERLAAAAAQAKRQRVAEVPPQAATQQPEAVEPEWRSRPYAQWSTVRVWQSYEGEIWARRRVELSDDNPACSDAGS